tara:strand:- start:341 stop:469 length:129 start_codon:yes stop_codon:yes gene_type:complete
LPEVIIVTPGPRNEKKETKPVKKKNDTIIIKILKNFEIIFKT